MIKQSDIKEHINKPGTKRDKDAEKGLSSVSKIQNMNTISFLCFVPVHPVLFVNMPVEEQPIRSLCGMNMSFILSRKDTGGREKKPLGVA